MCRCCCEWTRAQLRSRMLDDCRVTTLQLEIDAYGPGRAWMVTDRIKGFLGDRVLSRQEEYVILNSPLEATITNCDDKLRLWVMGTLHVLKRAKAVGRG